ncbi:bifunctional cobalt-precorrin-7 (C(5))-methyltransferase/cobalt-precorrin-6B (C(15))-methyltransferase [Dactylococcopsis salina]|uniref:tRNA (guanine(46)-N(7))-methyltransferase n=1 Tax=Dactylococcopsis salina (strain PCC 8305) TaxID=13035 RepID=K9YTA5_DACS8|nr:bifunctional cobalt-precorrin-7 (C(5))-methyltransferase/cobalt-precorrin-6B (C(15))-methyltransferase [Dactylococcopsis salina]AFZ49595.1 precorrin-6y C5,15-methyltransferase (decarboxylating), CbiE subunit,precorrin-6Y C5,15-methyltransferase (decarboxylating), CbiT subunit [Dactylococcopsis salina PCC 8305]
MSQFLPISVVGVGLDGREGLTEKVRKIINEATVLVGSERQLSYFTSSAAKAVKLGNLEETIALIKTHQEASEKIVILTSGDPLFYGLGRLLLEHFPPNQLTFYPHLSALQIAFNRIKIPWQNATLISAHGRNTEALVKAIQRGDKKIGILTDYNNNPSAIAQLITALDLPFSYQFWVCENLEGTEESCRCLDLETVKSEQFSALNVVILLREETPIPDLETLPSLGLTDDLFLSFPDRPGLMTKREIRPLILAELGLKPEQIIWDIGAGTGAVSIEIARLFPTSHIYALEKTAMGASLIKANCQRLNVENVTVIEGSAPEKLPNSIHPQRIFIGGTGGNLTAILNHCEEQLVTGGRIVFALATLENLEEARQWLREHQWLDRILQIQISRSLPIAHLTRFSPLNPVTLLTAWRINQS